MSIFHHFQEGGVFMIVILTFAVFTLAFIIERAQFLYFKIKSPPKGLRHQILSLISRGDFQSAQDLVTSTAADTSLGRVVSAGCSLRASAAGEEELQARMDEKLSAEISMIDKRTGFLAMFGNVSTLLGLLGTITGMIQAFASVSQASPVDRATMLSKGISEAMNCTAFGLIVAIPALVAYAIFQNKTDKIVTELTESVTQIYHDLLFHTEGRRNVSLGSENVANRMQQPCEEVLMPK